MIRIILDGQTIESSGEFSSRLGFSGVSGVPDALWMGRRLKALVNSHGLDGLDGRRLKALVKSHRFLGWVLQGSLAFLTLFEAMLDRKIIRDGLYDAELALLFSVEVLSLHPTPYTLHPAPCTLHHAPSIKHPASYTLHPAPRTLHPAPCTLPLAPCTRYPAPGTLHPAPCTLHPAPRVLNPEP